MIARERVDVLGVGNALVDLQVRVDDPFLSSLQVKKGEMLLVDPGRQSQVLKALSNHPVSRSSGGSAANTVVGIAELGGSAAYCGKVANDPLGSFYLEDLQKLGIPVSCHPIDGHTGTSLILITPDAQRTMLTSLGASAALEPGDIDEEILARAAYVYVEGYLFTGESTKATALRAIDAAKKAGARVALTVSDPFVINLCRDLFWELIRGPVDLLFCNQQEAQSLTELDDPIECARAIHAHAANVALTLGANGSILMHENRVYPIEGIPAAQLDTTGAGDMYAGALLFGLTHGLSWPQAGRLASHAAARIVAQLGARLERRFTEAEIEALKDERKGTLHDR